MSISATTHVWKHSPYKGVQKLIHLALADYANADMLCWPKQETLAEKATCTTRYLRETLKQMVVDGWLKVIKKGRRYAYMLVLKGEPSSPQHRNSVPPDTGTQFPSYIEPSEEPSEEPSSFSVPRAREEEESMAVVGALEPDEEPKTVAKSLKPSGHKGCVWEFENEARKAGLRYWNRKIMLSAIKQLHQHHDYDQIQQGIRTWFLRFEADIRSADDVSKLFMANRARISRMITENSATVGSKSKPNPHVDQQRIVEMIMSKTRSDNR